MACTAETVLTAIPAASDDERLLVVLRQDDATGSQIELRQQSWAEGIGWFTQSSIRLEPAQLANLRGALGGSFLGGANQRVETRPQHLRVAFPRLAAC